MGHDLQHLAPLVALLVPPWLAEGDDALAAPEQMRLEVLSAVRRRGLADADVLRTADILESFRIGWYPVDAPLARGAAQIATQFSLTVYDAAFAALAVRLDAELVTADRKLATSGACRIRLLGA